MLVCHDWKKDNLSIVMNVNIIFCRKWGSKYWSVVVLRQKMINNEIRNKYAVHIGPKRPLISKRTFLNTTKKEINLSWSTSIKLVFARQCWIWNGLFDMQLEWHHPNGFPGAWWLVNIYNIRRHHPVLSLEWFCTLWINISCQCKCANSSQMCVSSAS